MLPHRHVHVCDGVDQATAHINQDKSKRMMTVSLKTLHYKTFQLFIALTVKSENGETVISLRFSRLAAFAQHC